MNRISILAYHEPGERETSKNASKNKNRNSWHPEAGPRQFHNRNW
jgi:hypothetical protein